jgi:hypothetical protein
VRMIPAADVICLEAADQYVTVVTASTEALVTGPRTHRVGDRRARRGPTAMGGRSSNESPPAHAVYSEVREFILFR